MGQETPIIQLFNLNSQIWFSEEPAGSRSDNFQALPSELSWPQARLPEEETHTLWPNQNDIP